MSIPRIPFRFLCHGYRRRGDEAPGHGLGLEETSAHGNDDDVNGGMNLDTYLGEKDSQHPKQRQNPSNI